MELIYVLVVYGIAINLWTLFTMGYDKAQARKRGRRVPESTLFLLSAIGGALGGIVGMRIWRHKTKHASFVIGFPVLLILQAVVVYWMMK
jgi:uncharacterized membrane protein YsdA (DUF1294 family)